MKYFNIIRIELSKIKYYKKLLYMNIILSFINVAFQIAILKIFINDPANKLIWNQTLVYTFLSLSINCLLAVNRIPEFTMSIKKGNVIKYFIRPINIFNNIFFQEIGNSIMNFIQATPFMIIAIIISNSYLEIHNPIILFIPSVILSIILSVLITNTFFSISYITANYGGPKALLNGFSSLLSGALIPLILWPSRWQKIIYYTPFSMLIDGPIKLFLGLESAQKIIFLQLGWIVLFYFLGLILHTKLQKYCNFFGG